MKKSILSLLCILVLATTANAQLSKHVQNLRDADLFRYASNYKLWNKVSRRVHIGHGPDVDENDTQYLSRFAFYSTDAFFKYGSMIVTEHKSDDGKLFGITVHHRVNYKFDAESDNWYWCHYLPNGQVIASSTTTETFDKPGFKTFVEDGRLWVFPVPSEDLSQFLTSGEPDKCVVQPGIGPMGMTVKSNDSSVIEQYIVSKKGFATHVEDGRLWVFENESDELAEFNRTGEPAKCVVRPSIGPAGMTIKSSDGDVIDSYLASKTGYELRLVEGRLWVFKSDDPAIEEFDTNGELAKHIIRPGVGINGMTLKSNAASTITEYVISETGFAVSIEDGRLWVFANGSDAHREFVRNGEPAKCVVFPTAGPLGMTIKGADADVIEAYIRCSQFISPKSIVTVAK